MADDTDNDAEVIAPRLVESEKEITPDRRLLIWVIIVPYMALSATLIGSILFSTIEADRITLAASAILGPLGALAGGIIAYYFKSS